MTESLSPLVFGFAFTTVAGLLTGLVTRGIWRRWGSLINAVSDPWNAALIGLVERPLYLAALVGHLPAFIGIWLGLKFGGWWKASSENVALLYHRRSFLDSWQPMVYLFSMLPRATQSFSF